MWGLKLSANTSPWSLIMLMRTWPWSLILTLIIIIVIIWFRTFSYFLTEVRQIPLLPSHTWWLTISRQCHSSKCEPCRWHRQPLRWITLQKILFFSPIVCTFFLFFFFQYTHLSCAHFFLFFSFNTLTYCVHMLLAWLCSDAGHLKSPIYCLQVWTKLIPAGSLWKFRRWRGCSQSGWLRDLQPWKLRWFW